MTLPICKCAEARTPILSHVISKHKPVLGWVSLQISQSPPAISCGRQAQLQNITTTTSIPMEVLAASQHQQPHHHHYPAPNLDLGPTPCRTADPRHPLRWAAHIRHHTSLSTSLQSQTTRTRPRSRGENLFTMSSFSTSLGP